MFTFKNLPAGPTAVVASLAGLRSRPLTVDLQPGREETTRVALEPASRVEGVVSWRGIPHEGLEVVLTDGSPAGALRTYTDHRGRFSFSLLPSGRQVLVVGGTEIPDVVVGASGPLEIELPLKDVRLDILSEHLRSATVVELHPLSFRRHGARSSSWPMRVWSQGRQAFFAGVPAGRYTVAFARDAEVFDVKDLNVAASLGDIVHVAIE